jgi:hypothetical protein
MITIKDVEVYFLSLLSEQHRPVLVLCCKVSVYTVSCDVF